MSHFSLLFRAARSGRALLMVAGALAWGVAGALAQRVDNPYAITTYAGTANLAGSANGTGSAGLFSSPAGVVADGSGNLFIADSQNYTIRMVTPAGAVTTLAGLAGSRGNLDGSGAGARFGVLGGIAIDAGGTLYVTDVTNGTVRKVTPAGSVTTLVASGLSQPLGIAVDGSNNVYVADSGNFVVRKVTPAGVMTTFAGVIGQSNVLNGAAASAEFDYPTGLAIDGAGNVYVVDSAASVIREISGGVVSTIAGQNAQPTYIDGPAAGSAFNHPYAIAIDGTGNLFVTDASTLVREVSATGSVSTLAGTYELTGSLDGTGSNGRFNGPQGIAISAGVIFVADTGNQTVRRGTAVGINTPPTIQYQPASEAVSVGGTATFQVTGSGANLTYQWYFNSILIAGATTATLTIGNVSSANTGSYTVVIANAGGSITSNPAILSLPGAPPPTIQTQPASATVAAGGTANFQVTGVGANLAYQWYFNSAPIAGATSSSLAIANVTTANAGAYSVLITNTGGAVTSSAAVLTVPGAPAPTIQTQPASATVAIGGTANFQVTGVGANLVYQWYFNSAPITGATSSSLAIANVTTANAGSYTVLITNSGGAVTSNAAVLTVPIIPAPTIQTQPASATVATGGTANFQVTGVGANLVYQWYFNSALIAGATSSSLAIANVTTANAGSYTVSITNSGGAVTSNAAVLTVPIIPVPTIQTQPASATVATGGTANFQVTGVGANLVYQWYFNSTLIAGATGSSLAISNVALANAGSYSVVVTNAGGTVTSSAAILTVSGGGPTIQNQPKGQTTAPGSTAVFSVTAAAGAPPYSYQWMLGGQPIPGATSARLVIFGATGANAGSYVCAVTDSTGTKISQPAILTLTPTASPGRLINLSVLTQSPFTVGFYVGGAGTTGQQPLLIRATGPALQSFSVTGFLADPVLKLFPSGQSLLASNDNWASSPSNQTQVTAADSATSAFPLADPTSLDAALVATLFGGGYSTQITGNGTGVGVALAEVYDYTALGTYTASSPRLINLSCLSQVAGGSTLTAGFVVGGTTAKTVLIRAWGPTLAAAPFTMTGAMPDPQLSLHQTVSGADTILASDAGWGGDPQIATAASAVSAYPFISLSSKDSAILITLPPGNYSAQASSASAVTGTTLIEVYEIP